MVFKKSETLNFYRSQLIDDFIPFWNKALDLEKGGVFTCFSNDGTKLLSTDKYVWSQGRYTFCLAKLVEEIQKGYLTGDATFYLNHAKRTAEFIWKYAILPEDEGVCAYLLTKDGEKKESIPGKGYYTSVYVGIFVAIGFAQLAKVSGESIWLDRAYTLYKRTRKDIDAGYLPSEPFPTHPDFTIHGIWMVIANLMDVMTSAAIDLGHPQAEKFNQIGIETVEHVFNNYYDASTGLIHEFLPKKSGYEDTLLSRHICPGHEIEGMWFYLHIILRNSLPFMDKASKGVKSAFKIAWDPEYSGLFRMADIKSVQPGGRLLDDAYENLILSTWDTKLWWPHSETLYTSLLLYATTKDEDFLKIYQKTFSYSFRTFPNPDKEVGEWIQICDRTGTPEDRVVALPVKDPYHIVRDFLMIVELLNEWK